jgi:TM2 domain-containing membrane protein YozV/Tfp pilus assembly protein PilE
VIICPQCNNQVQDQLATCPYCGKALIAPNSSKGPYGSPPQETPRQPQGPYGPPQQGAYRQPQGPYGQPQQGAYGQPQEPYGQPQQGAYGQPQGPYGQPQQGAYGHFQNPYQQPYVGPVSPKSRTVVALLCFFLGGLGIHRFYLGKILTGILMFITLGGLGIWTLVDLFISLFGTYTDSKGLYVSKFHSNVAPIAITIAFVILFISFLVLTAIAVPQYNKYRQSAQNSAALSALHSIVEAEKLYFTENNQYTDNYNNLGELTLVKDLNVYYGSIGIYPDTQSFNSCFSFSVSHVAPGSTVFLYDSCNTEQPYTTHTSIALVNAW